MKRFKCGYLIIVFVMMLCGVILAAKLLLLTHNYNLVKNLVIKVTAAFTIKLDVRS